VGTIQLYTMSDADWGLTVGSQNLEDSITFEEGQLGQADEFSNIIMGSRIHFPLELIYQVVFIGGKRGSGKSYSSAVVMEEFNRLGLQFVCFDALDAHGHLGDLEGVEHLSPSKQETINMNKLVEKLKNTGSSLVLNMAGMGLEGQQKLIAEYCEAMLLIDFEGRGVMTFFEECQDFVPQLGRPESFNPLVRLCKLGRAKGYGVTLISQRPAAVSKEALSQASIYMVHNVINTKDLDALKEQLSFGTDKATIKKILNGITFADAGEMVCYAPEFFKDSGYVVVGKVDRPRRTEHKGRNIDVTPNIGGFAAPLRSVDIYEREDVLDYPLEDDEDEDMDVDVIGGKNLLEPPVVLDLPDYEWSPFDSEGDDFRVVESSGMNNAARAVGAIALLSTGVYLITRGLTRNA